MTPAILGGALKERIDELGRDSFSQHAIETVCFDLRIRRAHAVTGQFARELPQIQNAIVRFIVALYWPDAKPMAEILNRLPQR
jgi:hypothetical protein